MKLSHRPRTTYSVLPVEERSLAGTYAWSHTSCSPTTVSVSIIQFQTIARITTFIKAGEHALQGWCKEAREIVKSLQPPLLLTKVCAGLVAGVHEKDVGQAKIENICVILFPIHFAFYPEKRGRDESLAFVVLKWSTHA